MCITVKYIGRAVLSSNWENVMAAIYTMDGNELTAGLQGCNTCDEAIQAAHLLADSLGTDVHLVDDDGEWIVHPAVNGKRALADAYESEE